MIVTTADLSTIEGFSSRPGFCRRGARRFFARYGLDWSKFVREGIDAAEFEATGDALALALVAHARRRRAALTEQ